jgi:glycosyltransferase involved in cell wall biosynthesis
MFVNNNELPEISIILPVFNIEKYIKQCIESVLNQSYPYFECLCIDDCSTDGTLSILENYSANDKRIKIFSMPVNGGPGKARNFGTRQARGKYITFADHDDFFDEEWLLKMYTRIKQTNADCVYCAFAEYFEDTNIYDYKYFQDDVLKITQLNNTNKYLFSCKFFPPWMKLIKNTILKENKILFDENFNKFDDVLFTVLLVDCINSVSLINEILYYHRLHNMSITEKSNINTDNYLDHLKTLQTIEVIYNNKTEKVREIINRMGSFLITYISVVKSKKVYIKQLFFIFNKYNLKHLKINVIKTIIKLYVNTGKNTVKYYLKKILPNFVIVFYKQHIKPTNDPVRIKPNITLLKKDKICLSKKQV